MEEMLRKELTEKIVTLTEIPAPSFQEEKRAVWLVEYLKKLGYEPVLDEANNVYVVIPNAAKEDAYCLFTAHTDTVFSDLEISVKTDGGKYAAPGIGDDTANVALLLQYLEERVKKALPAPKHSLLIVFNSCEEGLGDLKGIRAVTKQYEGRIKQMIAFDGNRNCLVDVAVGSKRYEVSVATEGGHSYWKFGKANAIAVASEMIAALYQMDVSKLCHQARTTYNVGTIQGGTSVNTIAQSCTFLVEVRSDEEDALLEAAEKMRSIMQRAGEEKAQIAWKLVGDRPSMKGVDPKKQEQLCREVSYIIENITGSKMTRESGSTDCNIPLSMGIPAVAFGPQESYGAHTKQEWLNMDTIVSAYEMVKQVITFYAE